ncbi:MAG: aldo/keto reductase [Proteobacteria bacterium]|nr:aldo/keto reductase [Pseudomonadota bacterium]
MTPNNFRGRRTLGRTGLSVSRMGLSAAYKVPGTAVERAFHEYDINYFYWDVKKAGMLEGLRNLLPGRRDRLVIAIQSYDHTGLFLKGSVEKCLRRLNIDQADLLFLGWYNKMPSKRVLDVAKQLKSDGRVRFLGMSGHNRRFHGKMAGQKDSPFDVHQVRYNAAHRGAEQDTFPFLAGGNPGLVSYTATSWGRLLRARKMPPGEEPLSPADCYRFVLSNPAVDVCLCGPRSEKEMLEGLPALDTGPLSDSEMERICRIGDHVHG